VSALTTRVRGLAPWCPQPKTRELLIAVKAILEEYDDYLPLTLRQIFYRLVGAYGFDKTEQSYARLGEHLNRARRAGFISFDAIRDDGVTLAEPLAWRDATALVRAFIASAKDFRLDRQRGQPIRLIFAVEAAGMIPQVQRIANPFGIAVHSSGGFDSLTAKHNLAKSLGQWPKVEVLHIGDHDPSGVHLFSAVSEDVRAIARDLGLVGLIRFSRLAVTPAQITTLALPTAPAKVTDRRTFTGETTQCEAIPPDTLAAIIGNSVHQRLDPDALNQIYHAEREIRARLTPRLSALLDIGATS
jgi:hypothetical protein